MAHPYLALRLDRNVLVSHYIVTGGKNPLPLGMGSVKFHWRGGYLTRDVLIELLGELRKAGAEKGKSADISLNWPQAVLRVRYTDLPVEKEVEIEEANISEQYEES